MIELQYTVRLYRYSYRSVMQNLANDQLTPKIFLAANAAKFDQKGSKKNFLATNYSK